MQSLGSFKYLRREAYCIPWVYSSEMHPTFCYRSAEAQYALAFNMILAPGLYEGPK